jgi:hypothetical protein
MAMQSIRQKSAAAAAVIGMGALLVGCGSSTLARGDSAASFGATGGVPMSVSCEPNQRAVVRQTIVNGVAAPQVECQSVVAPAFAAAGSNGGYGAASPMYGASPVAYQPVAYQPGMPAAVPVSYTQPSPYEPTRIVRTAYPEPQVVTRQAAPQRVVYQRAPERIRATRSVKKSAVIIGSSAGVGAGIGAAVGGKKGAGIGALLGGGGAAIWDQITRRKQ